MKQRNIYLQSPGCKVTRRCIPVRLAGKNSLSICEISGLTAMLPYFKGSNIVLVDVFKELLNFHRHLLVVPNLLYFRLCISSVLSGAGQ